MDSNIEKNEADVVLPLVDKRQRQKENLQKNGSTTADGYSFVQLVLGLAMLIIGVKNLPTEDAEIAPSTQESDPCPNGAAYFLYVAGSCLLVSNFINLLFKICFYFAAKDGRIDACEACSLTLLNSASGFMGLLDIVLLVWGSVVVFGAWSSWTDDLQVYLANPQEYNYCTHLPMTFAFSILILKWVLLPLLIVIVCCCGACCALCACSACCIASKD